MNNNEFLQELEFFKNNPQKAEKHDRNLPFCVGAVGFIVFLFLIPFISGSFMGRFVFSYIMLGVIYFVSSIIIIEVRNYRIENFEDKIYTGEIKDLFGNLESPDIKDYLSEITQELKDYAGIRGSKAISIWNRINSPYIKEQRLKKEKANKQVEEIMKIQLKA